MYSMTEAVVGIYIELNKKIYVNINNSIYIIL